MFSLGNFVRRIRSFMFKTNYNFNKSNPLGGQGERVDIQLAGLFNYDRLDMYQKSHFRRYEFANEVINSGSICGDFACGTGYGSVLLADKAKMVIGSDLNTLVIDTIKERYNKMENVVFLNEDILKLSYHSYFDVIISFETIEHFEKRDIRDLLNVFAAALKNGGLLIFSTPYKQERTDIAIKMGFHLTFDIDEMLITQWLNEAGFELQHVKYQNYKTHNIESNLDAKDFIIGIARKVRND